MEIIIELMRKSLAFGEEYFSSYCEAMDEFYQWTRIFERCLIIATYPELTDEEIDNIWYLAFEENKSVEEILAIMGLELRNERAQMYREALEEGRDVEYWKDVAHEARDEYYQKKMKELTEKLLEAEKKQGVEYRIAGD